MVKQATKFLCSGSLLISAFPQADAMHDSSEVVDEVLMQPSSFSIVKGEQEPSVQALANLSWAKSQDELSIECQQKEKDAQGILKLQLDSDKSPILRWEVAAAHRALQRRPEFENQDFHSSPSHTHSPKSPAFTNLLSAYRE